MPINLAIGQCTDPGRVRKNNEDAACALLRQNLAPGLDALLAVADGMGGPQAGEVASAYVATTLQKLFATQEYQKWVDYAPDREDYNVLVLKEILERMNEELFHMASTHAEWRGMGTTATMALIVGTKLYLGHVGDSRAYLIADGSMRQITKDHTWVMEQVDKGKITLEQAATHLRRNEITRALGVSTLVRVDRTVLDLQVGNALVLCTDGLTNLLSNAEIHHMVQTIPHPQQAARALIDLANQRGGTDNITVVIMRVLPEGQLQDKPAIRSLSNDEIEKITKVDTLRLDSHPPASPQPLMTDTPILFSLVVFAFTVALLNALIAIYLPPDDINLLSFVSIQIPALFLGMTVSTGLIVMASFVLYGSLLWRRGKRT